MADKMIEEIMEKLERGIEKQKAERLPYEKVLMEELTLSKEQVSSLMFDAADVLYSPEEFCEVVKYYCEIFEGFDNFIEFVNSQHWVETRVDLANRRRTLFTLKPYKMFGERMLDIEDALCISRSECIKYLLKNPSWLYHKKGYFDNQIKALCMIFEYEREDLIFLCKKFPFILTKRIDGLSRNIDEIAKNYNVDVKKVKDLMIKHPLLLNKTLYFFLDYKLGEEVFDKPWIISALTNHRGLCEYGGYKTFNNLLRVSEKVEENFGEIVNFYKREFADGLLMCFLTQKEDKNYLVSLGANTVTAKQRTALTQLTPEEKLLRQIFGEKAIPTEEQEIRPHYEYVCEIDVIEDEKVYDVIYLLAVLSSCNCRRDIKLKESSKIFYLTKEMILPFSMLEVSPLVCEEGNLNVSFYKVEPMEEGKVSVTPLWKKEEIEDFDDIFDDVFDDE